MLPGRPLPRRVAALAVLLLLAGALRFFFLCDDAYIAFTYARNLAAGHGATWYPGQEPVEGYSDPLWVLWLALLQLPGVPPAVAAPWTSLACGVVLLLAVGRLALRTAGPFAAAAAMLWLALLPPMWVWSTSGLETMPGALLAFLLLAAVADRERPRGASAGLWALGLCLLRPEGLGLAAVLLGSWAWRWLHAGRPRPEGRALALAVAILLLGLLLLLAVRLSYYGQWLPNTAAAKGGLAWFRLPRGLNYLASFLVVFPGVLLALLAGLLLRRPPGAGPAAAAAALAAAAQGLYAVAVGGDFMAMGRFLVPALPCVALLLGQAMGGWWARSRRTAACAVTAAAALADLPAAFDLPVLPEPLRQRLHFRGDRPRDETELVVWRQLRDGVRSDEVLARALARRTAAGESLVREAIGVLGYHGHLRVIDSFALVTRRPEADHVLLPTGGPGHDRYLPWPVLLPLAPTYIHAHLAPPGSPVVYGLQPMGFPYSPLSDLVEVLRWPVDEPDVDGRQVELRLLRFLRHDPPSDGLAALVAAASGVDPAAAEAGQRLERALPAGSRERRRQDQRLRALLAEGRIAQHGEAPLQFSRAADATPRTAMFGIDVTLQQGPGVPQRLPRGKLVYALAIAGEPRCNGRPMGWSAVPPGRVHVDEVSGGTALLVHLVPGGAVGLAAAGR